MVEQTIDRAAGIAAVGGAATVEEAIALDREGRRVATEIGQTRAEPCWDRKERCAWILSIGSEVSARARVGYIVPFLFVLTVVVFFHELGHFLVARWCGVGVKVFSIGFGPELFGFNDRKGTRWRLSLDAARRLRASSWATRTRRARIEANRRSPRWTPEERARTFAGKSVATRAAIVAAGPVANFILAIAIFTAIFTIYGREEMTPTVDTRRAGQRCGGRGFQPGDIVVIDQRHPGISTFTDLQRIVSVSAGDTLTIVVDRGGKDVDPQRHAGAPGDHGPFRQQAADRRSRHHAQHDAGATSWSSTTRCRRRSGDGDQGDLVRRRPDRLPTSCGVVVGRESADQLGGPIRVAEVSAQVATLGFVALINLAAILSISIGLINLFPMPMLDGGHLLFFGVEAVRGKPLSERAQEIGFRIGFAAVLTLMIFATWNDIIHLSSLVK